MNLSYFEIYCRWCRWKSLNRCGKCACLYWQWGELLVAAELLCPDTKAFCAMLAPSCAAWKKYVGSPAHCSQLDSVVDATGHWCYFPFGRRRNWCRGYWLAFAIRWSCNRHQWEKPFFVPYGFYLSLSDGKLGFRMAAMALTDDSILIDNPAQEWIQIGYCHGQGEDFQAWNDHWGLIRSPYPQVVHGVDLPM